MKIKLWILAFAVFTLAPIFCFAVGVPHLRLDELVKASDVIAVGQIKANIPVGKAEQIDFHGQQLPAQGFKTELIVWRFIKGSADQRIVIRYSLPVSFNGYRALGAGTRMVFLKQGASGLVLADHYYPDFPAVALASTEPAADAETAVVNELLRVVGSPSTSDNEKGQVLRIDYALPHTPQAIAALRDCQKNAKNAELKQRALGELISFGDIDAVPQAAETLVGRQATEDQRIWLLFVIAYRLTDAKAIPALKPMLSSDQKEIRASAVQALWHISGPNALPGLAHALQDSDRSVRFYAVRGLSDIAQESGWGGPSEAEFNSNEQMYLKHWSNWTHDKGYDSAHD